MFNFESASNHDDPKIKHLIGTQSNLKSRSMSLRHNGLPRINCPTTFSTPSTWFVAMKIFVSWIQCGGPMCFPINHISPSKPKFVKITRRTTARVLTTDENRSLLLITKASSPCKINFAQFLFRNSAQLKQGERASLHLFAKKEHHSGDVLARVGVVRA